MQGLTFEQHDSLIYVAVPQKEHIQGYSLINVFGQRIYQIKGKAQSEAQFKWPSVPKGHYLLMIEGEKAYFCHRVYIH